MPRRRIFVLLSTAAACSASLVASCEADPGASSEETVAPPPPAASASHETARAWVDPLAIERATSSDRQRVIVEVGAAVADEPRYEAPDGRGFRRPSRAALRARQASLDADKEALLGALVQASPDTVTLAHWYPPFALLALEVTSGQLEVLSRDARVRRIHADREERAELASSLPAIEAPWFHQNRASGAGTAVAVLDTPVRYDNGSFGSCPSPGAAGCAVAATANFSPQTSAEVIAYEDANGKGSHGTNVAAIVHGVAPDAKLLGLNVFYWNETDGGLRTQVSDQIDALGWVANHASTYDIVAVNISIGGTPDGPATCNDISRYDPIRTLWEDHGILTVIASGNDREENSVASPGCLSMAVTVGAHFDTDLDEYAGSCSQLAPVEHEIACFSNLSGMVDLLAPGVFIDAGGYLKSGTSMATPHVAGAVAAWQSWFLADEGAFKTPFWMHKRLLVQTSAPHVHVDGRRYQRLDFDESVHWDYGHAFPYWFREAAGNAIPTDGTFFETTLDVADQGWDVKSAYLALDVAHLQPQHLEVHLIGPNGSDASFALPGGQAHFTGVVGRTVLPGALSPVEGESVDGTWTLRIRDTVGSQNGNYLQAALYFTRADCSPSCEAEACGDDTCGGSCGAICVIDGACRLAGDRQPGEPCRGCVPDVSTTSWSVLDAVDCDDGNPCTTDDRCETGLCGGEEVVCPAPGACQLPGSCEESSGDCTYPALPDGTSCSDDDPCTVADACVSGVCSGTAVECPTPNACVRHSGCDPVSSECLFAIEPDGTPCPGGQCISGSCVSLAPSATGAGEEGGCSCSMVGQRPRSRSWAGLGAFVLWIGARRRARRRGG